MNYFSQLIKIYWCSEDMFVGNILCYVELWGDEVVSHNREVIKYIHTYVNFQYTNILGYFFIGKFILQMVWCSKAFRRYLKRL
jgi:hypothetical protein